MRQAGIVLIALSMALFSVSAVVAALIAVGHDDGGDRPASTASTSAAEAGAITNDVIAFFEERVERDPGDFTSYTKLGDAYIRQARETGDISAYGRAEASFEAALELYPAGLEGRAGLASVRFALHDFRGALDLARDVYADDPGATGALAIIADAHLALGEYDEAAGWYAKLDAEADGPAVDSRLAQLAFLTGDTPRAIELMERAVSAAGGRGGSPETLAFYRTQLGDLHFGAGEIDGAATWYESAMEGFEGYAPALAGLGATAAARDRDAEAIDYYERAVAIVPSPQYLAALGDIYMRAGDDAAARRQYETVELIGELAEIDRAVYNRELALYLADHSIDTPRAVELAVGELDARRDIYGFDAAAWALYQDGHADEALPYMEQALRFGTRDARLYFHAGMIERALGHNEAARAHLETALEINPHFSVLHARQARHVLAALDGDALAER